MYEVDTQSGPTLDARRWTWKRWTRALDVWICSIRRPAGTESGRRCLREIQSIELDRDLSAITRRRDGGNQKLLVARRGDSSLK